MNFEFCFRFGFSPPSSSYSLLVLFTTFRFRKNVFFCCCCCYHCCSRRAHIWFRLLHARYVLLATYTDEHRMSEWSARVKCYAQPNVLRSMLLYTRAHTEFQKQTQSMCVCVYGSLLYVYVCRVYMALHRAVEEKNSVNSSEFERMSEAKKFKITNALI